jgi:hypothetical protein
MEEQITMVLSGAKEQAMSILAVEEASSSSAPWLKCCRHYVNRDREAVHLRLEYDYFNDECVYPRHTSTEGTVCGELFS